jgi:hypothetical protein
VVCSMADAAGKGETAARRQLNRRRRRLCVIRARYARLWASH